MPDIEIDVHDVADVTQLSDAELLNVPHEKRKWRCCAEDCDGYSTVKDYGILPIVNWKKKWTDLRLYVFYCSRHWPKLKKQPDLILPQKPGSGIDHLDAKL